jgi:hypothetical protein
VRWPWSKPVAPPTTSVLHVHLPYGQLQLVRFQASFPEIWIDPEYDDVEGTLIVGVRITPAPRFRGAPDPALGSAAPAPTGVPTLEEMESWPRDPAQRPVTREEVFGAPEEKP